MRKDVNKKSNNKSKVVSALAMLLVSAVALSSASYAWFTMSKEVSVTGIELQATAPDNVLICNNAADFGKIENYANSKELNMKTKDIVTDGKVAATQIYVDDEHPTKLIPASSANGVSIYSTDNNISKAGIANADATFKTITEDNNTTTSLYYADVPLYILTTGEGDVTLQLDEGQSKIEAADNDEKNIFKAVRFAILDSNAANLGNVVYGENNKYLTTGKGAVTAIGTDSKATTFETDDKPAVEVSATSSDEKTRKSEISLVGTKNATNKNVKDESETNKYQYTKIIVRIWVEGQNKYCVTENADAKFKMNLVFTK